MYCLMIGTRVALGIVTPFVPRTASFTRGYMHFHEVWTINNNYPFRVARLGDKFIVREAEILSRKAKSLTNCIEDIIEHIIYGLSPDELKTFELYQYSPDGVFKIDWYLERKITRDMPLFKIVDVKWSYISKDLSAFEVLFGNK